MMQKVSAYMGGLGIDATDKLVVQANATITVGNGTSTGNVIVGGTTSASFFVGDGGLLSNIAATSTSAEAPSTPKSGDLWYDSDDGVLSIRYDNTWVAVTV